MISPFHVLIRPIPHLLQPARKEPEADFMLSRSMAARDVAATLQRLDAEVLREVAKLLLEFLKLPLDK